MTVCLLMLEMCATDNWNYNSNPDFVSIWLNAHTKAAQALNKPLLLEEVTLRAVSSQPAGRVVQRCSETCEAERRGRCVTAAAVTAAQFGKVATGDASSIHAQRDPFYQNAYNVIPAFRTISCHLSLLLCIPNLQLDLLKTADCREDLSS